MTKSSKSRQESRQEHPPPGTSKRTAPWWGGESNVDYLTAALGTITAIVTTITIIRDNVVKPVIDPIRIKVTELKIFKENPVADGQLIPITVKGVITNTSQTKLWLIKPHWVVFGYPTEMYSETAKSYGLERGDFLASHDNIRHINKAIDYHSEDFVDLVTVSREDLNGHHQASSVPQPNNEADAHQFMATKHFLGMGPLITDFELQPNQETRFKRVMLIPADQDYSFVEAVVNIPGLRKSEILKSHNLVTWGGCVYERPPECGVSSGSGQARTKKVSWKRAFCQALPFSEHQKELSLTEIIGLFSPHRLLQSAQGRRPKNFDSATQPREFRVGVKPALRYCSRHFTGLGQTEISQLGASIVSVIHEEPWR